jgi:hypothetical protein
MKCLHLVTRSLDPAGTGRARWTMRRKPVIDAFGITFGDRWPGAETSRVLAGCDSANEAELFAGGQAGNPEI